MKQIILHLLMFSFGMLSVTKSFTQEHSTSTHLLHKYYAIKNALVSGDGNSASKAAGDLQATLQVMHNNAAASQAVKTLFPGLNDAAADIKTGKDINKQREAFARLSQSMISLIKIDKPSDKVYVDYCPMKKASWLSAEQAIKNPYYGSSMLTCGKITDTLQ